MTGRYHASPWRSAPGRRRPLGQRPAPCSACSSTKIICDKRASGPPKDWQTFAAFDDAVFEYFLH